MVQKNVYDKEIIFGARARMHVRRLLLNGAQICWPLKLNETKRTPLKGRFFSRNENEHGWTNRTVSFFVFFSFFVYIGRCFGNCRCTRLTIYFADLNVRKVVSVYLELRRSYSSWRRKKKKQSIFRFLSLSYLSKDHSYIEHSKRECIRVRSQKIAVPARNIVPESHCICATYETLRE